MAIGLRGKVDFVQPPETPQTLRLAWSVLRETALTPPRLRRALRPVTPEELFAALDGVTISSAKGTCTIEVFSVSDEAGRRWLQLALEGSGHRRHLTLRLKTGDTAQHAVHKLSSWLSNPAASDDVINVA